MYSLPYLHENFPAFIGRIKSKPEDFKVWELDKNGVCCTEQYAQNHVQLGSNDLVNKDGEKLNIVQDSTTLDEGRTVFNCDVEWCRLQLSNHLPKLNAKLANYADEVLNEVNSSETLKLGQFSAKAERTVLHKAVRFAYPYLQTETSEEGCIFVKPCSVFVAFKSLLGTEKASDLIRFVLVSSKHEKGAKEYNITGNFDKQKRTLIHHGLDHHFGRFLVAKTKPGLSNASECRIEIHLRSNNKVKNNKKCCKFVLYKENCETIEAVHQLANCFNMKPHQFSYAGIKDKKAQTWQHVSAQGIDSKRLLKMSSHLPGQLRIHDAIDTSSPIRRGELSGNRFAVKIRNVQKMSPERGAEKNDDARKSGALYSQELGLLIRGSLASIEEKGFINYFGPQRFGRRLKSRDGADQSENAAHEASSVGLAILKGEFKEAVDVLLAPNCDVNSPSEELSNVDKAKLHYVNTGDVQGALRMMPKHKSREVALLRALNRFSRGDVIADGSLKRDARSRDQHELPSKRTKLDADDERPSADPQNTSENEDVTSSGAYVKALLSLPHSALTLYAHAYCSHVWNRAAAERIRRHGYLVVEGDFVQSKSDDGPRDQLHAVSTLDVASGLFSARDVVLPLPGNKAKFPPNMIDVYERIMTADGVDAKGGAFNVNQLKLKVPGAMRKLFSFPENVSFSMETRHGVDLHEDNLRESPEIGGSNPALDVMDVEVKFDLLSSCYATSLLREWSQGGVTG